MSYLPTQNVHSIPLTRGWNASQVTLDAITVQSRIRSCVSQGHGIHRRSEATTFGREEAALPDGASALKLSTADVCPLVPSTFLVR